MILVHEKLKKYMTKKNLNIIKISIKTATSGWCAGAQSLQVEAIKEMENENGFTKYEVDDLNIYIYDGLKLEDKVEIRYLYSIPIIGTVLSASGLRMKN